jgi:hypothetical protein
MYRESLRVALASGRLRPSSTIPNSRSKVTELPKREDLKRVLQGIAQILEKTSEKKVGKVDGASEDSSQG